MKYLTPVESLVDHVDGTKNKFGDIIIEQPPEFKKLL